MHSADNPSTHEGALAKKVVVPLKILGNTNGALTTGAGVDPMKSPVEVITQPSTLSVLDPLFTSPANLQGGAPARFSVVVLDGNAKRFRGGLARVTKADSAGNAAQFVIGVVAPGDGVVTANGNVAVTVTLNGAFTGAIAVSGTFIDLELNWN